MTPKKQLFGTIRVNFILEDGNKIKMGKVKKQEMGSSTIPINTIIKDNFYKVRETGQEK